MKGKRGYVGRMITTVDLLQGKAKREYMKPGKVVKWNMYKQLIPFEELQTYTPDQQRKIVEKWREVHTLKEITNRLGLTEYKYYKLLEELGIRDKKKKRIHKQHNGTINIISYREFKEIPESQKFYVLEEIGSFLSGKEIAKAWGLTTKSINQIKYLAKKFLRDRDLPLERPEHLPKINVFKEVHEKESKESIAINSNTEKAQVNNLMEFYEEEPKNPKKAREEVIESFKEEEERENLEDLIREIRRLKEELKSKKDDSINNIRTVSTGTTSLYNPTSTNLIRPELPRERSNGMSFTYQDEKEGFLLHADIEQFITMLKKNPNNFKVKMKITTIEV